MIMTVICKWMLDSKYYILFNLNLPIKNWRISRISLWGPPFSGLRSGFVCLCSTPTRRAFLRLCVNGGWRWPPTWMREVDGVDLNGKCGWSKTLTWFTPVCLLFRPTPYLNTALKPLFIDDDQRSGGSSKTLTGFTPVCPSFFRPATYLNAALKPLFIAGDQRLPFVTDDLNGWTSVLGIWAAQYSDPADVNPTFRSSSLSSLNVWSTYATMMSDWLARSMTLGSIVSSCTDMASWFM